MLPIVCVALVGMFGLFAVFRIPPLQVADEPGHFLRAYELSKFHPIAHETTPGRYGFFVPEPIHRFSDAYLNILFTDQKDARPYSAPFHALRLQAAEQSPGEAFNLENVAIYSPVAYVPQAMGIGLARLLDLTLLQAFYMGRIFGLLAFIGAVILAFRLLPRRAHFVLFVVATLPAIIGQAASYSADGITTSMAILLVAFIAYIFKNHQRPGFHRMRALLVLGLLVVLLALCKQVYCLLGILAVPAAWKLIANKKLAVVAGVALLFAGLAATGLWNLFVSDIGINYAVISGSTTVEPAHQLHHMLTHPLNFLRAVYHTTVLDSFGSANRLIVSGLVGKVAAQGAFLPEWGVVIAYISMLLAIMRNKDDREPGVLSSKYMLLVLATCVFVFFGVTSALYISFTAYHSNIVTSLSGRYFAPLAAVLLLVALWKKSPAISLRASRVQQVIIGIAVVNCAAIALAIADRFIV